jgi:hypothetical protein
MVPGRYRLLLRSSDRTFFADNFINSYLPTKYHLSTQLDGPANAAGQYREPLRSLRQQQQQHRHSSSMPTSMAAVEQPQRHQQLHQHVNGHSSSTVKRDSAPLTNETWWRLYCAGDVMACYLATAMHRGLNLQVPFSTVLLSIAHLKLEPLCMTRAGL